MRRHAGILGLAVCTAMFIPPATAQPPLPPPLPAFVCPTPGKPCPQPPPDRRQPPAPCKGNPGLIGRCYWVRGIYTLMSDSSVLTLQNSPTSLWVDAPPDNRPRTINGRIIPANVESALGPNLEGVFGLYEVCPIPHIGPWGGKRPAVCIDTARDVKTVPFSEAFYRRYPQARRVWDAFQKRTRNGVKP